MKNTLLCVVLISLCGCARFVTTQTDVSGTDQYGQPTRTITTKAKAITFFAGESKLANFKASQTDKTQGASVGSLEQNATATNLVSDVGTILGSAMKAFAKP